MHVDGCETFIPGQRVDLVNGTRLPSPLCTIASGFRRATKPEVLLPGGRQLYMPPLTSAEVPARFAVTEATSAPGHMTAAPGLAPLELGRVRYCCGSSNAAALASRSAALAFEGLVSGEIPTDCEALEPTYTGVVLKTLLVHAASWGNAGKFLEETLCDQRLARESQDFAAISRIRRGRPREVPYGDGSARDRAGLGID